MEYELHGSNTVVVKELILSGWEMKRGVEEQEDTKKM